MATLQNYISLRDGVSPMLEKMSRAAHTVSNKLNIASGSARNAGDSFGYAAEKAGLFKSILAGNIVGNVIMRGLDSIAGSISGAVALADEYTSLNARLALVAGSQSNVAALNDMIYESAQRARGGYMDMAKAVASLSVNARDAFPDPRKTVQFMEGMQKLFVIGGASKENQQFAMLQLQQSLASGRLQGDEFRSITENAPILQDMIAKTMKVSRGELKQLSAQGEITADIIKRAIFENMDEINDKFESMPKRWSDHFTDFKNVVLKSFAPIAERINRLANSEGVRSMFSMLKNGVKSIMPVLYAVIGGVEKFVNMFNCRNFHRGVICTESQPAYADGTYRTGRVSGICRNDGACFCRTDGAGSDIDSCSDSSGLVGCSCKVCIDRGAGWPECSAVCVPANMDSRRYYCCYRRAVCSSGGS